MYYLKQSYSDQIIICNPENEIICRVMHYDFNNEEEAIQQAEIIVNSLNETEEETEKARETHDKLREILIDYNSPEFGDCIVDDICSLFKHPTTIYTDPEEETADLFQNYETIPENVKSILEHYGDTDALTYEELAGLQKNLETIGYTFDYGLDAQPFNLRKI